jgi:hypothetical protein
MPKKMEIQRLQILAGIVKKENTKWKGIPAGERYTFQDVLDCFKKDYEPSSVYADMTTQESLEFVLGKNRAKEIIDKNKKRKANSDKEFISKLDNQLKEAEKEYGNDKEDSN